MFNSISFDQQFRLIQPGCFLLLLLLAAPGFAQEVEGPAVALPEASPAVLEPKAPETVLLDDALPESAQLQGNWLWNEENVISGVRSHAHPSAPGKQSHGLRWAPVKIPINAEIVQQVWLDPQDPPQGIALKVLLEEEQEIGVYWEGEEEVFTPDGFEELWYYGLLPELGRWVDLEILVEDMGIERQSIVGLSFLTFNGTALWDATLLREASGLDEEASEDQTNLEFLEFGETPQDPES